MFCARNPSERERLKELHVSIVGCGSFGSAMADMLVRAGLGRLTLIDPEPLGKVLLLLAQMRPDALEPMRNGEIAHGLSLGNPPSTHTRIGGLDKRHANAHKCGQWTFAPKSD